MQIGPVPDECAGSSRQRPGKDVAAEIEACPMLCVASMEVTSLTAKAASFFSGRLCGRTGQSSPENIASGVDVGMCLVTAQLTSEHRLADAVTRVHVPAFCARLAGVPGVHVDHCPASLFRFALKDRQELSPARIGDTSIQAALGGHVDAGVLHGPLGRSGHVLDLEDLDAEHVVIGDETTGDLVMEVQPLVGDLAMPGAHDLTGGPAVVRSSLLFGEVLLSAGQAAGCRSTRTGLAMCSPAEVVAKLAMPTSMPICEPVGSRSLSGTSSHERTRNHLRPSRLTEIVLTRPSTARCTLTFTCPTPWR